MGSKKKPEKTQTIPVKIRIMPDCIENGTRDIYLFAPNPIELAILQSVDWCTHVRVNSTKACLWNKDGWPFIMDLPPEVCKFYDRIYGGNSLRPFSFDAVLQKWTFTNGLFFFC